VIHNALCLPYSGRKTLVVRGFSLVRRNGTENCCREPFGNCLRASVRQPPRLANIKGKPTKRIVCILRVKCAGGNGPTYGKELLNSRKKQPFLQNESSRLPPRSSPYPSQPYSPNLSFGGAESGSTIRVRPATNQALCPQNTAHTIE
jgi:hypothetical protein